jgi:phosphoenolpyruvate synthase/pyruvate phosphate dikinase
MSFLIHFKDISEPSKSGGKACKLTELFQKGFNVPAGAVLSTEAYELFIQHNTGLKDAIEQMRADDSEQHYQQVIEQLRLAEMPGLIQQEIRDFLRVAGLKKGRAMVVRSSGTREDGADNSFAGQFESILHLNSEDAVIQAVISCWSSLFGRKVLSYCRNNNIAWYDFSMSVVIQEFIPSDVSGVVFTVNPMTGNDKQMVIEAAHGQGEALVQGVISPDRYHYNWYDETFSVIHAGNQDRKLVQADTDGLQWMEIAQGTACLTKAQVEELAAICLKIQQFYGEPQDIEWALFEGVFYVLQARPLTSIHFDVQYEWTTADLKDGGISSGVTTPMMFSLYEFVFESTMPEFFRQIKILPDQHFDKWFDWWFGISYWNMKAGKEGAKLIPGFNERNFDKSLGIEPDYEGDGYVTAFTPKSLLKGVQILIATNNSIRNRPEIARKDMEATDLYFDRLKSFLAEKPTLQALTDFFETMVSQHYFRMEGSYFYAIYDNSNAATFCQEAIQKFNKSSRHQIKYLNVVAGLNNLAHLRPAFELWDLARAISKNAAALEFYQSNSTVELIEKLRNKEEDFPMKVELQLFVEKYAYHSIRELDLLVPNWDKDPSQPVEQLKSFLGKQQKLSPQALAAKQTAVYEKEIRQINNRQIIRKIETHRQMLWLREELRDHSSAMYHHIRLVLLAMAESMLERGMINQFNDVFYLKFGELIEYCRTNNKAKYLPMIEKNIIFYQSYRNFRFPNEIWQKGDFKRNRNGVKKNAHSWQGIGGSHGELTGRVVVINSIWEADKISEGDILVTKFTDPAWTVYFSKISGLVTEFGGMLSHGAVVSREYGIPAVMGVKGITGILKTGDIIEMDGETGVITKHKAVSHD